MTGQSLLEKRLALALPQTEMADRMKVPIATYTRLEQNKDKEIPPRYEPAVELIEIQRCKELSKDDLKKLSAALRHSYETRIESREKNRAAKRKSSASRKD